MIKSFDILYRELEDKCNSKSTTKFETLKEFSELLTEIHHYRVADYNSTYDQGVKLLKILGTCLVLTLLIRGFIFGRDQAIEEQIIEAAIYTIIMVLCVSFFRRYCEKRTKKIEALFEREIPQSWLENIKKDNVLIPIERDKLSKINNLSIKDACKFCGIWSDDHLYVKD